MLEWLYTSGEVPDPAQAAFDYFFGTYEESTKTEPGVSNQGDFVVERSNSGKLLESAQYSDYCLNYCLYGDESPLMKPKISREADFGGGSSNANRMGEENNEDHVRYQKFFKAIQENNWKGVEDFIADDPQALNAKIKVYFEETILNIISRNLDAPFKLVKDLASRVDPISLETSTEDGPSPAIFWAAAFGNKNAVEAFVCTNKNLPNIPNAKGLLPIHEAAACGRKEVIQYLLSATTLILDDNERDVIFLLHLINYGIYDKAFDFMKVDLARKPNTRRRILRLLANKPRAFRSGSPLGYWEDLIYSWAPIQEHIPSPGVRGDEENPSDRSNGSPELTHSGSLLHRFSTAFVAVSHKLHIVIWKVLMQLAPRIKEIRELKVDHTQILRMVRMICHEGVVWDHESAKSTLRVPLLTAAKLGIHELVNEILNAYFYSYTFADKKGHSIFHLAILHRQDKVFSVVNKMNLFQWDWKATPGMLKGGGNFLDLVGMSVPSNKVSGAALQMQRELQWFKAVESYVHPSLQERQNELLKTPREVFTEKHEKLVEKGEKWMKDTAQSCTVVAALILTVVFAAAFTVPGGNNNEGIPNFLHDIPFIIFAISDALALFSSTTSVLMFLAILTSRYSEDDFLESLPKKLIIGLITLFFSIASMTTAFGATIYIVLSHPWKWVIIPIACLGCFPVTLFVCLQFPLLVEIYLCTYRSSILRAIK